MRTQSIRPLDAGYTSEVDTVDEQRWCEILQEFDDANIYQTWSYAAVTNGRRRASHLILKRNQEVAAAAQVRIEKLPFVNVGIAYVRWGPLWRRYVTEMNFDVFRQAIRALRNEFACKRGLVLRLFPALFDDDSPRFSAILDEEGFSSVRNQSPSRTILMNLSPPLADLREGMRGAYKRNLKLAERNGLEVVEGSEDQLFATFIDIYKEMVSRKRFVAGSDVDQFRLVQAQLPEKLKMRIVLCKAGADVVAGLVFSAIGKTAIYLFGATSNAGMKSRGSYLLHWKLLGWLRQRGFVIYNLHGINQARNPGTYKFKSDLAGNNGKDVSFLGRFDSHTSISSYLGVECGEALRTINGTLRELTKTVRDARLWPKAATKTVTRVAD